MITVAATYRSDPFSSSDPSEINPFLDDHRYDASPARTPQTSASTEGTGGIQSTAPSDIEGSQELVSSPHKHEVWRARKRSTTRLEHFELIRVIGKGCAGRVLLARHAPTNTCHAMKAISKRSVFLGGEIDHTLAELSILKRFAVYEPDNPFICRLNYAFTDRENFYFVMDFYPGGDLATQMEIHGALGGTRTRFYACDIVQALEDIHRHGIICRDLKPENILLNHRGHAVLADFGLSKEFPYRGEPYPIEPIRYPHTEPYPEWAGAGLGSLRDVGRGRQRVVVDRAHSFVGTAEYLAPEVIMGAEYSYAIDYWSLGCIILESLIGQCPFRREEHEEPLALYIKIANDPWTDILLRAQFRKKNLEEDYGLDGYTRDILDAKDPMRRLMGPFVKHHNYFFGIDWDTVIRGEYTDPEPLNIHPMAEYNTRYFPKLHANDSPNVDMSTHSEGDDKSRDAERRYRLEAKRFKRELDDFKWDIEEYYEMNMDEDEYSVHDDPVRKQDDALSERIPADDRIVDGNGADLASRLASLDKIPESPGDLKLSHRLSVQPDIRAEADKIPAGVPKLSRPSYHFNSSSATVRESSLRTSLSTRPLDGHSLPPGAMPPPSATSPITSPKLQTSLELQRSRTENDRAKPLPITGPPLTREPSRGGVLPAHLPSSGLSVSDVVSIASHGLGSPRLVRRHAPKPSVDTIPINRLSIDLHGTITQIEEDDWEELQGESIPSLPNGRPYTGSGFFHRLRRKPSQITTSGLRRQIKSSDSSRETSPTKPPKSSKLSGNTRKALEKVFPRMRKSGPGSSAPDTAKLRKSTSPSSPVVSPPRTPNRPGQIRRHTESAGWFERRKKASSPREARTSVSSATSVPGTALSPSASGAPTLLQTPATKSGSHPPHVEAKADEGGSPRLELKATSPVDWDLERPVWDLGARPE